MGLPLTHPIIIVHPAKLPDTGYDGDATVGYTKIVQPEAVWAATELFCLDFST